MIWASWVGARDMDSANKYPPCSFNHLCTCSKLPPDLGVVTCRNVPFPAIPKTVNISKVSKEKKFFLELVKVILLQQVFALHMEHTGLIELEPHFLQATGTFLKSGNRSY